MGHAGVYELELANELGVDRCRVSLGVYGSEIELPGDYQMTVPAVPLAKFGPYVAKSHEKNNVGFTNQYRSTQIQQVTQFHITNWSPDGVCTNLATITDVIEEVDKVQRRTGNQPIVVHCRYFLPLCLGSCEIT
ncbi:hypothetical protein EMCRGX_G018952 [Ephydatia muelleri]